MRHRMFIKLVLLNCILAATLATEELKDRKSSNKQDDILGRIIDNGSVETSVLHNISSNFEQKLLSSEHEKITEFVLPGDSATETSATSATVQDDVPKPSLRQGMKRNRNRLFLDDPSSAAEKSSGRKKGDYRWGASATDDFLQKLDRDPPVQHPKTHNVVVAKNSNYPALVSAMSKISAHHVSHSSNSKSGLKQLLSSSLKEANDKTTSNKVMTENVNKEQGHFVNANSDLGKLQSAINGLLNNPSIYENMNNKLSIVPNDNEDLVEAILNATIGNDQSDKLNGHQTILNVIVINVSNNILNSNSSSGADNRIGAIPNNYLERYLQNEPSYPQQVYNPYIQKQPSRPQQILKGQNLNVVGEKNSNSMRIDNRQGINLNKNTVLDLLPDFIRATTIPPIVSLFNTSAHRNLGAKPSVLGLLPNEVFDVQKTTVDLHSNHIGGGVVRKNDPIETWKPYPDAKLPYSVPSNAFGYSLIKDKIDTSQKKVEPVPQLMNKYNGAIKRKPTIKVNNQRPMASMPLPQTQVSQDFSIFDLLAYSDNSNNDQHVIYPIDNATMFENFRNYTRTAFENISNTSLRNIMIGAIPSTAAMATATFPVWAPVLLGKRRRKRDTHNSALWYNLINGSLYLKNKFPASDVSTSNASNNNKVFTSDLAALLKKSATNYDDPYEYYDSNELEFGNIIYDKKLDESDSIINYENFMYSLKNDNLDIEKSSNLDNNISSFVIYKDNSEDTNSNISENSKLITAANNVSTDEELPFGDVDLVNNLIFQMDDKSHAAKADNVNKDEISHNNDQNVSEEDIALLTTEIPKFANVSKNDSADMYVINGKLSSLVNSVILNEINRTDSSDGIEDSKPEDVTEIIIESGNSLMQNPVDSRIDNLDRNISNNEEKLEMFQYLKSELQNENYLMNVNNTESVYDNLTLSMTIPTSTNTSASDNDSFFTTIESLSNIISESDQNHSSIESATVSDIIENIKSLITKYPTTQMKNRSKPTKSTNPMKILSTIKSTTPTNVVRQTTPPFTTAAPSTTTTPTPGTHAVRQNTPVTTRFTYPPTRTTTTTTTMKTTPAPPQDLYSYITSALANPSRQLAEAVSYSSSVAVYTAAALMPIWLPMSLGKRKKRSLNDSSVQPKYYPGESLRNNLILIDNEE